MPKRLDRLPDGAPLSYAPNNEQGVVFLFSGYARKHGLRVESVQGGYPDCIAYRDGQKVRIEFEYRSRNFAQHRHDPEGCDMIVCWIHDWSNAPAHLEIVELQREYGLGFNVWLQPVSGKYSEQLLKEEGMIEWSVASQASPGDLVLFYHARPLSCLSDVFVVTDRPYQEDRANWKRGTKLKSTKDYFAQMERVAKLGTPVHLSELREHRVLGSTPIVRRSMVGRFRMTPYWKSLYDMVVGRNPRLTKKLSRFGPHRLTD